METAINKEMLGYFNQLSDTEKNSVLIFLKKILEHKDSGAYTTIEEYNKELEEAEEEYRKGEFITNEELLKQIKEW